MAIVVEEKKNQIPAMNFLGWIIVLAAVAAGAYFIFFKKPELVEFNSAPSFNNLQQLSNISINPEQLIHDPQFETLKQYITLTPPQNLGRSNPFLGF